LRNLINFKVKHLFKSKNIGFGRNNSGSITVRHIGGGFKKIFRILDLRRNLFGERGLLIRIEFDPNRSAYIGLLFFSDIGLFSYILLPEGLKLGSIVNSYRKFLGVFGSQKFLGSSFRVYDIPISTSIFNVELEPGAGGKIARSAGTHIKIIRKFGRSAGTKEKSLSFVGLRFPSGKFVFVSSSCIATIGSVSNIFHQLEKLVIAGKSARLGIRPSVRGVAMNPVDHPHGGGEGKTSGGRPSVSLWGKITKGGRTTSLKKKNKRIKLISRINSFSKLYR
jgi:large subunit ribosomal protein L2